MARRADSMEQQRFEADQLSIYAVEQPASGKARSGDRRGGLQSYTVKVLGNYWKGLRRTIYSEELKVHGKRPCSHPEQDG